MLSLYFTLYMHVWFSVQLDIVRISRQIQWSNVNWTQKEGRCFCERAFATNIRLKQIHKLFMVLPAFGFWSPLFRCIVHYAPRIVSSWMTTKPGLLAACTTPKINFCQACVDYSAWLKGILAKSEWRFICTISKCNMHMNQI